MIIFDMRDSFTLVKGEIVLGKTNYWILAEENEIEDLKEILNLNEENIRECLDYDQFSKISFYKNYIYLISNVLVESNKNIISKELNIFVSQDYILTVYKSRIKILDELIEDIIEGRNCFMLKENPAPSILLYYLLDRIVVRNYDIIAKLEARADKIELGILRNPNHQHLDELIHLRRQVYKIRKYLNPLRYIGDSLISNENSMIEEESLKYFVNLNHKIEKLLVASESLVQDLSLVREAFESEIANKTNELMKVFSLIATIFLPLGLITGVYGMGFANTPFINHEYGFYILCAIMIIISIGLVILFKVKKWL